MRFDESLAEWRQQLRGDFIPAVEAMKFVAVMKKKHPQALREWLEAKAVQFCTAELSLMLRHERAAAGRRARPRAFALAAQTGDVTAFGVPYVIAADKTRRPVADMTGADHLYVASNYAADGNCALLLAECHRIVARKVGDRRTADVLTEAEYLAVFDNVLGQQRGDQAAA